MNRRSIRQSGFSLVELLVTALIFGIGLLGLAALQVSTIRSNSGGRNRVTATALAEGCMSAIQAEGSTSWTFAAKVANSTNVAYPGIKSFTGVDVNGVFGYFNVDGQPLAEKDPGIVFTVTWARNDGTDASPKKPISGMELREFVATVTWKDVALDAKGLAMPDTTMSMSRLIRY